ncbi:hypothetical protein PG984_014940 [Apiospora sp. TS-2023a]
MGDFYPDYDPSKEWWPGDPPPRGGPIELDDEGNKIEAFREIGHGTLESPKVIIPTLIETLIYWQWETDVQKLRNQGRLSGAEWKFVNATDNFVVNEVRKLNLGITHIWIRKCGHNFQGTVSKVTGKRVPRVFEPCDPHITVYLGREMHHALVEGHLYVAHQPPVRHGQRPLDTWSVVPYKPMALKDRAPAESVKDSKTWRPRNPELWKHDHNGSIAQAAAAQSLRQMNTWRPRR